MGKAKQPYCFEVDEGDLFAFAGIWDRWKNPSGDGVKTCSILTTTPNAFSSDRDTKPGRATLSWDLLQSTAIYIVRADGTRLRRLTDLGGYSGSPQWSRDGRRIVFYQSTPLDVWSRPIFPGHTGSSQIVSIDVETGRLQTHTTGPGVKVSPRYTGGHEIAYVVIFGDKQGLRFTSDRNGALGAMRYPSWSPDGKRMVYPRTSRGSIAWRRPSALIRNSNSFPPLPRCLLTPQRRTTGLHAAGRLRCAEADEQPRE
jgi:Tol biopolymer transport system component